MARGGVTPLEIDQGTTESYVVQLRGPDGAEIAPNTYSTPTLALSLWTGDNGPAITLSASTVGSFDATTNRCTVTLHQTDFAVASATIPPAKYRLRVLLTSAGVTHTAAHATLTVNGTAGAVTPGAVYCTMAQVVDVAGWIPRLITDNPGMQSDLGEARAQARRWFNRQLVGRARQKLEDLADGYVPCLDDSLGDAPDWIDNYAGQSPIETQLDSIRTFLAGTYLADTDAGLVPDEEVAEICAYFSAYAAAFQQIGEKAGDYLSFGRDCSRVARNLLAGYVARIYTDDATAPYAVLRP